MIPREEYAEGYDGTAVRKKTNAFGRGWKVTDLGA